MLFKKLLMILCLSFLWSNVAQAKGAAIFNTGEEIFDIAPLPAETIEKMPELKGFNAGYKCSHFGLFWADVWTWDCSLVATNPSEEDTYYELPSDIQSSLADNPEYQKNKTQRNFWNQYGIFIMILALIGFILMGRLKKS